MIARRTMVVALLLVCFSRTTPVSNAAQKDPLNLDPVVIETPWGQHVVPDFPTYLDIQVYRQLKPGEPWSAGDSIRKRLAEEYHAGKLRLWQFPWKVIDKVYALGKPDEGQLIYLIDTGAGLLLIDPSYDTWQDALLQQIRQLGFDPSQVRWILLTHCHVDHAQSCHLWKSRGARILVPDADVHPVESGNLITAWWLVPPPDRHFTGCAVNQRVYDGDLLQLGNVSLYAIATPGHTPGATCYYLSQGGKHLLFSGDNALHAGRHAWMGNAYADWEQYLRSLEKLARFSVNGGRAVEYDILLPGHGAVDLDGAARSVQETIRIVRNIAVRRQAGENIEWIDPYPWNWTQGISYQKGR